MISALREKRDAGYDIIPEGICCDRSRQKSERAGKTKKIMRQESEKHLYIRGLLQRPWFFFDSPARFAALFRLLHPVSRGTH